MPLKRTIAIIFLARRQPVQCRARQQAAACRGQAYLRLKNTAAAAAFQTIPDHRGYAPLSPLYTLAQLGLARATNNRIAYDDFFALWKEADVDLPPLIESKKE
jgi:hypothetical protein